MYPKVKFTRKASGLRAKPALYSPLPESEETDSGLPSTFQRTKSFKRWVYVLCLVAAASLGGWVTLLWSSNNGATDVLTCGTTNEEAKALGCIMEPMVYGWMPKPCYFASLSSQYSPFDDRPWYLSNEYREEERIPPEDIWTAKHSHIYTPQYHGEHCLFLWRKLNLAVQSKSKWLDHKTLDMAHTDHCVMELEDHGAEWRNSSNDVVLGFYRCMKLDSL